MEQAQGTSTSGNTMLTCPKGKFRGWIFTIWDESHIWKCDKNVIYNVAARERCPETDRIHYHQFVYFKNPRSFSSIKSKMDKSVHIEIQRGTNSDADKYVRKDGDIIHEFGKRPNDNGIKNIADIVETYNTISEVMQAAPKTYCQYRSGINDLMREKQSRNRFYKPPTVIWIHGKTGTGKTRTAFEDGAVPVEYNNGFFSDWGDAKTICIEEFRGGIPYGTLLKLLDGYHNYYQVNIKGGQKLVDLDKIYITSPLKPNEIIFTGGADSIDQLLRRITEVRSCE